MKRKSNWREKLDPAGIDCLEGCRKAADAFRKLKGTPEWRARLKEIAIEHPQIRVLGKVELLPDFVNLLLSNNEVAKIIAQYHPAPGTKVLPAPVARFAEVMQLVTLALEDPEMRIAAGFVSAFAVLLAGDIYEGVSRSHYGDAGPKTYKDFTWTLGTTLEILGKGIKTGKGPHLKGKINIELIEMIKILRSHQKGKLTYRELREALEYAGVSPPDEETLRLFEWRARKKGWIKSKDSTR
jgi:hypothetical protein